MKEFKDVPFGNSVFQITNFTDGKETPERRYRHLLLQLHSKQRALKECEFRRRRADIDIAEITEKLDTATSFEKQRLEIDLEEKEEQLEAEIKFIEDCLIEVHAYKTMLKDFPAFTRQEFEAGEQGYWEQRLLGDARREFIASGTVSPGVQSSLENIGILVGKNRAGQLTYTKGEKQDDRLRINETNSNKEQITDSE